MGAAFANKAHLHEHTGFLDFKFPAVILSKLVEARIHSILDMRGQLVKLVCVPIFDNSQCSEDDRNTFDHLYSNN